MRYTIPAERSYAVDNEKKSDRKSTILYGLAFDSKDSHKRITTGEDFYILGGSAETHEILVEKVLEFNKTVKKYGKKLDDLSQSEFNTIAKEVSPKNDKTYWFFSPVI